MAAGCARGPEERVQPEDKGKVWARLSASSLASARLRRESAQREEQEVVDEAEAGENLKKKWGPRSTATLARRLRRERAAAADGEPADEAPSPSRDGGENEPAEGTPGSERSSSSRQPATGSRCAETGSRGAGTSRPRGGSAANRQPLHGKGSHCEVQKHSGMACAVVSMESVAARDTVMAYCEGKSRGSDEVKTEIGGGVVQLRRRRGADPLGQAKATDIFCTWGHRAEGSPLGVEDIAEAFDTLLSEGRAAAQAAAAADRSGNPQDPFFAQQWQQHHHRHQHQQWQQQQQQQRSSDRWQANGDRQDHQLLQLRQRQQLLEQQHRQEQQYRLQLQHLHQPQHTGQQRKQTGHPAPAAEPQARGGSAEACVVCLKPISWGSGPGRAAPATPLPRCGHVCHVSCVGELARSRPGEGGLACAACRVPFTWEELQGSGQAEAEAEEPAAAAPAARSWRAARRCDRLVQQVFRECDLDGDGRLREDELAPFAAEMGFGGSWHEEYERICSEYSADPRLGFSVEAFQELARADEGAPGPEKRAEVLQGVLRRLQAARAYREAAPMDDGEDESLEARAPAGGSGAPSPRRRPSGEADPPGGPDGASSGSEQLAEFFDGAARAPEEEEGASEAGSGPDRAWEDAAAPARLAVDLAANRSGRELRAELEVEMQVTDVLADAVSTWPAPAAPPLPEDESDGAGADACAETGSLVVEAVQPPAREQRGRGPADGDEAWLQERLRPLRRTRRDDEEVLRCLGELQEVLQHTLPQGRRWRVRPFGSSVNGFGMRGSDLDAVAELEGPSGQEPDRDAKAVLWKLAGSMEGTPFEVKEVVLGARVPILRLVRGSLDVDLSVHNATPLRNTRLLRGYASIDERVASLGLAVKLWARERQLCGAHAGHLSSYALTLMVVYFLQVAADPPLPSLQRGGELDSAFEDDGTAAERARSDGAWPVKATAAALYRGFFRFYAEAYDWGLGEVVSVRLGRRRPLREFPELSSRPESRLHVEDPFERARDLGDVLRGDRGLQLAGALREEHVRLQAAGQPSREHQLLARLSADAASLARPQGIWAAPPRPPAATPPGDQFGAAMGLLEAALSAGPPPSPAHPSGTFARGPASARGGAPAAGVRPQLHWHEPPAAGRGGASGVRTAPSARTARTSRTRAAGPMGTADAAVVQRLEARQQAAAARALVQRQSAQMATGRITRPGW